ncbi:MAG: hypothetical protein ABL970_00285 [Nitrospira sp.]
MTQIAWLAVAVLLSVLVDPVYAVAEISEQEALESSHKAIAKYGVVPPSWVFHVDHDLQQWHTIKSRWQERSLREKQFGREDTDFGPWLAKMEAAFAGKHVWAVVYKLILAPGERAFHPNAVVFVDADSGTVLAFIEPEGYPRFPK